jgi:DsbC/DsbD-like thiol-disulfide interchange protein
MPRPRRGARQQRILPQPPVLPVGLVLLTRLTTPAGLAPGAPVTLKGRAAWLLCEKTCILDKADFALTHPVGAAEPAVNPTAPPPIWTTTTAHHHHHA